MKTRADFEQAGEPPAQAKAAARRLGDARKDLQERAFARAIAADDAQYLALGHFKRNVVQGHNSPRVGCSGSGSVVGPAVRARRHQSRGAVSVRSASRDSNSEKRW